MSSKFGIALAIFSFYFAVHSFVLSCQERFADLPLGMENKLFQLFTLKMAIPTISARWFWVLFPLLSAVCRLEGRYIIFSKKS